MFKSLRAWLAARDERRREKFAKDHSFATAGDLAKAQRNFGAGRRRMGGQTGRRPGQRY